MKRFLVGLACLSVSSPAYALDSTYQCKGPAGKHTFIYHQDSSKETLSLDGGKPFPVKRVELDLDSPNGCANYGVIGKVGKVEAQVCFATKGYADLTLAGVVPNQQEPLEFQCDRTSFK